MQISHKGMKVPKYKDNVDEERLLTCIHEPINFPLMCQDNELDRIQSEGHFTHEIESPWPLHCMHSLWWKWWSRSKFASHNTWGTNGVSMWTQDGCKVHMDSYMASNGSCFMVTWTTFKNHLLEVGLTQNHQKTMALRMLRKPLLYSILSFMRTRWNRNSLN